MHKTIIYSIDIHSKFKFNEPNNWDKRLIIREALKGFLLGIISISLINISLNEQNHILRNAMASTIVFTTVGYSHLNNRLIRFEVNSERTDYNIQDRNRLLYNASIANILGIMTGCVSGFLVLV